jgi:hypothetical protein
MVQARPEGERTDLDILPGPERNAPPNVSYW